MIPTLLIHLGQDLLDIKLDFLTLLGWFTLVALLVNEVRSILENLVECDYKVPDFLIWGLAATEKLIHAGVDIPDDTNRFDEALKSQYKVYEKEDENER